MLCMPRSGLTCMHYLKQHVHKLKLRVFLHGIFLLSSRMNVLNVLQVFCKSSIISIISHTLYSQCTKTTYIYVQSIGMGELFVLFLILQTLYMMIRQTFLRPKLLVVLMYDRLRARGRESACVYPYLYALVLNK